MKPLIKSIINFIQFAQIAFNKLQDPQDKALCAMNAMIANIEFALRQDQNVWDCGHVITIYQQLNEFKNQLSYSAEVYAQFDKLENAFAFTIEEDLLIQTMEHIQMLAGHVALLRHFKNSKRLLELIANVDNFILLIKVAAYIPLAADANFTTLCTSYHDLLNIALQEPTDSVFKQILHHKTIRRYITTIDQLNALANIHSDYQRTLTGYADLRCHFDNFSHLMHCKLTKAKTLMGLLKYDDMVDLITSATQFAALAEEEDNADILILLLNKPALLQRIFLTIQDLLRYFPKKHNWLERVLTSSLGKNLFHSFNDIKYLKEYDRSLLNSVFQHLSNCALVSSIEQLLELIGGLYLNETRLTWLNNLSHLVKDYSDWLRLPTKLALYYLESASFAARILTDETKLYAVLSEHVTAVPFLLESDKMMALIRTAEFCLKLYALEEKHAQTAYMFNQVYSHPDCEQLHAAIIAGIKPKLTSYFAVLRLARICPSLLMTVIHDVNIQAYLDKPIVLEIVKRSPQHIDELITIERSRQNRYSVTAMMTLPLLTHFRQGNTNTEITLADLLALQLDTEMLKSLFESFYVRDLVQSAPDFISIYAQNEEVALELIKESRIRSLLNKKAVLSTLTRVLANPSAHYTGILQRLFSYPDITITFTLDELSHCSARFTREYVAKRGMPNIATPEDYLLAERSKLMVNVDDSLRRATFIPDLTALGALLKISILTHGLLIYPDVCNYIQCYEDVKFICDAGNETTLLTLFNHAHIAALPFTLEQLVYLLASKPKLSTHHLKKTLQLPVVAKLITDLDKLALLEQACPDAGAYFFSAQFENNLKLAHAICKLLALITNQNLTTGLATVFKPYAMINSIEGLRRLVDINPKALIILIQEVPEFIYHLIDSENKLLMLLESAPSLADNLLSKNPLNGLIKTSNAFTNAFSKTSTISEYRTRAVAETVITTIADLHYVSDVYPPLLPTLLKSNKISSLITDIKHITRLNLRDERAFECLQPVLKALNPQSILREKDFVFWCSTRHLSAPALRRHFYQPHLYWDDAVPIKIQQHREAPCLASLIDKSYHDLIRSQTNRQLLSLADYFDETQFGKSGYYTKGRIRFGSSLQGGHYQTNASKGYVLAIALAERLFSQWQLAKKNIFKVTEIGAGDGDLCYKILFYLENKAVGNAQYQDFYTALQYNIIDRSPALNARQRHRLQHYKHKVNIYAGNAMNLAECELQEASDIILSNELLDMLGPEQIKIFPDGSINVLALIPIITLESLAHLVDDDLPALINYLKNPSAVLDYSTEKLATLTFIKKLIANADNLKLKLTLFSKINVYGYPLDKNDFINFFNACDEKALRDKNLFTFVETYIPLHDAPAVQAFLKRYPEALEGMQIGSHKHIQLGLDLFMQGVARLGKIIISIDYGKNTYQMINGTLRTYGNEQHGSPHYTDFPGRRDITTDVDYSLQAIIGIKHGLTFHGYFAQQGILEDKHQVQLRDTFSQEFSNDISALFAICGTTLNADENHTGLTKHEVEYFHLDKGIFWFSLFSQSNVNLGITIADIHRAPNTPTEILKHAKNSLMQ